MKASGYSLYINELKRDFNRTDLLAVNAFIESRTPTHCTQFGFWDYPYLGEIISGRNMDGETDIRKVTVSHFLIFAVDPGSPKYKFISFMWPGFIGTSSGFNETGLYIMENAGQTGGQGNPSQNLTPSLYLLKYILENFSSKDVNIPTIQKIIDEHKGNKGGTFAPGIILVFLHPVIDHQKYLEKKDEKKMKNLLFL